MLPVPPSTVPFDMEPEILPEGAPVPLNDLGEDFIKENSDNLSFASISTVVPLNPKPWLRKWENLQTHLDGFRCSILILHSLWQLNWHLFHSLPEDLFSTPGPVRRIQRFFLTNLSKSWLLLLHRTFAENSIAWHQQTLEYDLMRDYRCLLVPS